jgi:hypothetical protein
LDEPERAKKIIMDETRSRRSRRSPPLTSAGAAPFSLVAGWTPVAAVGHGALGSTSTWGERARVGKVLGSEATPSAEPSPSRLGFILSHIQFDWFRFGCVAVGSFFGFDTVMVIIAE